MGKDNYKELKDRYLLRNAAGEYFLLDVAQNSMKVKMPAVINETGADIWKYYTETGSIDGTVKKFCEEYGIDETTAEQAVITFLDDLKKQSVCIDDNGSL